MPDFNETHCSGELMHESGSSGKMFLFWFVFIYYREICGVAASKGTNGNGNDLFFMDSRKKETTIELNSWACPGCASRGITLLKQPVLTWLEKCTSRREQEAGCG